MMRRAPTYIMDDQERAAAANAPTDSVYFENKEWVNISAITNPDARRRIDELLIELRNLDKPDSLDQLGSESQG